MAKRSQIGRTIPRVREQAVSLNLRSREQRPWKRSHTTNVPCWGTSIATNESRLNTPFRADFLRRRVPRALPRLRRSRLSGEPLTLGRTYRGARKTPQMPCAVALTPFEVIAPPLPLFRMFPSTRWKCAWVFERSVVIHLTRMGICCSRDLIENKITR